MRRTLREIQEIVMHELLSDRTVSDAARELFCSPVSDVEDYITIRFAAYRRNLLGARLKALSDTYRRTKSLVGEKYFRQIARHFARLTASTSADLGDYGMEFPEYIRSVVLPRKEAQSVPYLADVASLDRAVYRTSRCNIVSEPGVVFRHAAPWQVAPGSTSKLLLNASLELVRSRFPLYAIWDATLNGSTEVVFNGEAQNVAVWVTGEDIRVDVLLGEDIWILEQIQTGSLLEEVTEKAPSDVSPENVIPELIKKGLIIGYR